MRARVVHRELSQSHQAVLRCGARAGQVCAWSDKPYRLLAAGVRSAGGVSVEDGHQLVRGKNCHHQSLHPAISAKSTLHPQLNCVSPIEESPFPLWGKARMGAKTLAHRRLNRTNAIFSLRIPMLTNILRLAIIGEMPDSTIAITNRRADSGLDYTYHNGMYAFEFVRVMR